MPMVIQLSLLAATHDLESFAEGMSEALRLRTKDPVTGTELPYATSNDLKGLLRACQEQTSGFQWTPLIHEVEHDMDLPKFYLGWPRTTMTGPNNASDLYQALPVPILQASLDMLGAVQRLYEDSFMVIDSCKGVSTMVVWAYYVLGLTVCITMFLATTCIVSKSEPADLPRYKLLGLPMGQWYLEGKQEIYKKVAKNKIP
jgi:hypothetical protein